MSNPDLVTPGERLRALAEKATPGPWSSQSFGPYPLATRVYKTLEVGGRTLAVLYRADASIDAPHRENVTEADYNAEFIAACDPQTILTLLDALVSALTREQVEQRLTNDMLGELVRISGSHPGRRWDAVKERMRAILLTALFPAHDGSQ